MPSQAGRAPVTATIWIAVLLAASAAAGQEGAAPARVGRIAFEGRESIERRVLLRACGLTPGTAWTEEVAVRAIQGLLREPFIARVEYPRTRRIEPAGDLEVTIAIRERPVVARIDVHGNSALSLTALREVRSLRPGQPLRDAALADDRAAMLRAYHDDGFLLAQIDTTVSLPGPGRAEIDFTIDEGRRISIDRVEIVRIDESHGIDDADICRVAGLQPSRLFGVLERGYYRPHTLEVGLQNLRTYYRSHGYLDVEVGLDGIEIDPHKRYLTVQLRVEEGTRYRIAEVLVAGNTLFPEELVRQQLDLEVGVFYSGDAVEGSRRNLVRWYQERSDRIPTVRARLRDRGQGDEVIVLFEIDESDHRFVGRIDITGNELTKERVIRQRSRTLPGEPLTLLSLDETATALRAIGIFEDVRVTTQPRLSDPSVHDVEIAIDERKRWIDWEVGGGASSGEGEVGYLRLQHRNFDLFELPRSLSDWTGAFTGGGQSLAIEVIPGHRESQYFMTFREPYLFQSNRSFSFQLGTLLFDYGSYDESRLRSTAEIRQYLDAGRRLSAALSYRFDNVQIADFDSSTPAIVRRDRGYHLLAYPRAALGWQDLDTDPYSGPVGSIAELRVDFADSITGSDVDFTRALVSGDWFAPLFDRDPQRRHQLHVGVEAGWIGAHDGDRVPFYENFHAGGPKSIRGFSFRGVGPHVWRTAIGGGAMLRGTVEYSMPLFAREVRGVALFDWGMVEDTWGRVSTGEIRTAAGIGLQLRMKVFGQIVPVNLYWVEALSAERGDRERMFTFTLGYGL